MAWYVSRSASSTAQIVLCPLCRYPATPFFLRVISSRVYDLGSRPGTGVIFHRFVRAAPPPRTSRESLPALLNAVPRRFSALLASNDGGARENTRERKEKREREEGDREERSWSRSREIATPCVRQRSLRFLQRPWVLGIGKKKRNRLVMHRFLEGRG